MKGYKLLRGLLKTSAIASIMFVMQACYGAPHPMDRVDFDENEVRMVDDTIQETVEETESQLLQEAE